MRAENIQQTLSSEFISSTTNTSHDLFVGIFDSAFDLTFINEQTSRQHNQFDAKMSHCHVSDL